MLKFYFNKAFHEAIKWLIENGNNGYESFIPPTFAGMPEEISSNLFPEEVELIQQCWDVLTLTQRKTLWNTLEEIQEILSEMIEDYSEALPFLQNKHKEIKEILWPKQKQ